MEQLFHDICFCRNGFALQFAVDKGTASLLISLNVGGESMLTRTHPTPHNLSCVFQSSTRSHVAGFRGCRVWIKELRIAVRRYTVVVSCRHLYQHHLREKVRDRRWRFHMPRKNVTKTVTVVEVVVTRRPVMFVQKRTRQLWLCQFRLQRGIS